MKSLLLHQTTPNSSTSGLRTKIMRLLLPALFLLLGNLAIAQNLTQSGFNGVTVPQYMASGTSSRMPVLFRATVTGLTANTSYRYFTAGATNSTTGGGSVDFGTTNPGAGNTLLINSAGTTFTYSTGGSLTSAGNFETFTTDASGNYTGWFGFVNTGNGRFTAGNIVYPSIVIGSATGTTLFRRALDQSINVLAFGTTASSTAGTLAKSTTSGTAKNIAVIYDNTSGTGRPLNATVIENIGVTIASVPANYSVTAGTWNAIIPNVNTNGVKRIEQRGLVSNSLLGCAIDSDGIWPTGSISTVNPTGSTTTPVIINGADDALTSCSGTALISATGTLVAVNTTYGTASASTTFTVSGSSLTNDIVITAPAGYEVSKTIGGASGYATSQTLTQSSGTVVSTTIYVRIAATSVFGSYSGNVTLVSAPAATVNVATVSSDVAKKALTVTGAAAQNKIYDQTTAAVISGATASGTVNGDVISIVGGGTFAQLTVGNAIDVTAALTFSGTNSGSYTLAQPTGLSANITAKDITISGASASTKEYDGNADAMLSGTLSGVISPDDVALTLAASFDGPNVGTAIPVTSFSSIAGVDAGNYNLVQPTGLSADITAKELVIIGASAQNKMFDGNTDAIITGTLSGVISPDDVTLIGTGTFAQSAVGLNIPVTSTSTIVGDISNYILVQPTGLAANISSGALTPQTITFDPLSDVTYGGANFNLTATSDSGLTVSYVSSNTDVATILGNVISIVGAGSTIITASQQGDLTYDSAPTVDQNLNVLQKELTANAIASNKVYDGNDIATVTGTLVGVVGSDDVTFVGSGNFATSTAGTAIEVISSSVLDGTKAANYLLVQPVLFADITPKTLTVAGALAANKVYDGNTDATVNGASLVGIISPDNVTISGNGTFASADVANGIAVSANLTLGGADAANYTLTQPIGLTANITPLALTISGVAAADKVYDSTTNATVTGTPVLNGVLGADVVAVSGTVLATFSNKTVGIAKPVSVSGYVLSGAQAGNYTVSQPAGLTANISQASLTIAGAVAQDKPFDGTTAATITGTLSGVIASDVVTLVGTGTFASSAVGTGISVTSTSTLAGTNGANYTINPQPIGLTANIVPGPTVLAVGDLSIIGFNFNTPDNFAFVTWVDLLPNTLIKFTDNGFLAATSANATNNARGGENILIWKNNGATIAAGTVITIEANGSVSNTNLGTVVSGNLNGLSASGDNIFAYQGAATSGTAPDYSANSNPATFNGTLLFGLYAQASSSVTTWLSTGTASSNTSYLPTEVTVANGNIALGSAATRGQFSAPRNNQTSLDNYKALVTDSANWTLGASSGIITLNTTSFTLATPPSASVISGTSTVCIGTDANISVAITGGLSPYSVVYTDGTSNFTVNGYLSGTNILVSPTATTTYTLISVTDAAALVGTGNSGSATITVNQNYPFYVDADADTYGAGAIVNICAINGTTAPTGYSVNNTDCNDQIAAIHPGAVEIAYNGVDDNCDGNIDEGFPQITTSLLATDCNSTVASINSVIGITTLAPGSAYTGWRVRLTNGAQVQVMDFNVPHFQLTQFASYAYATTYTVEIMLQRNGVWLGYYGPTCQISSPAILAEGGSASVSPSQCGITLPRINTLIATTSLLGVNGYRFRVTNLTLTTGPNVVQIIDRTQNWFSLQMLTQYNYGSTYRIEIAVKTGTGQFGGFGAPCEVSSPASPSLINCGGTIASGTATVAATSVSGANQYRFQITRELDGASTTIDRSTNYFIFNALPASIFTAGALYDVRVAVMTSGTWSPFGDLCTITAPGGVAKGMPAATLQESVAVADFKAVAYPNPFVSDFAIDVTASDASVQLKIYDMLGQLMESKVVKASELNTQRLGDQYPSGVYNVVLSEGDVVKTLRVIKR